MKLIKQGLCLALLGTGLAVLPSASAGAAPDRPSIVERMRAEAEGTTRATTEDATGKVGFVRTTGDLMPTVRAGATAASAAAKATAYLDKYAAAFGADATQLRQSGVESVATGHVVEFAQTYQGIPVFAGELLAHVDDQGDLTSVNGFVAPGIDVPTDPVVGESAATDKALRLVRARPAGAEGALPPGFTDGLSVVSAELMVYRMGAIQGISGRNVLAWVIEVTNERSVRETVVLDAVTGKPVNRYSMMPHALERHLFEGSIDDRGTPETTDDVPVYTEVWEEGDPFPDGLDEDQQNEVLGTGEAYWMFMNTFGYDSYDNGQRSLEDDDPTNDGQAAPMITVNNDPAIRCPNANWNGETTNYCSGVSSDDTVAHEWGHAYTEYTSGLLYQWQPGAMNEAYSDIWGETVDMLNDRMNSPDEETRRTDGQCSVGTRGDISMVINTPGSAQGPCTPVAASFGPIITEVTSDMVVGTDAADPAGPSTTDGCSPFTNAADIAGKFVYVDRGTCAFTAKIDNAEAAGATGIIFGNNTPAGPISVAGNSELYGAMVTQADGTRIKNAGTTLNVTLADATTAPRDSSYRWLSGEDDPAFGGAIRDMWNPTCYGDPGKVSDVEYHCDGAEDNGGVHTNSGVVNHTYALLVDGGTYNGVTVPAIGLDKAANLYWHVQSTKLTPLSGFPEFADALEASCAELTGKAINQVTLGDPAQPDGSDGAQTPEQAVPITAADCAAVSAVIRATELRQDAVQCNFQAMLEQGQVSCGNGLESVTTYTETFEGGLAGWTQDEEAVFAEASQFEWKTTTQMPPVTPLEGGVGTHSGTVAWIADPPRGGTCLGDAGDLSARDGLISPSITVPAGFQPRLSFDHYVATESTWDGGNVKVSVNGADFELIDPSAYLFNGPQGHLASEAEENTNPMAGEPAWTGTDGGEVSGSWGTTYLDLSTIAQPGDSVQFRFDFGRDGCNGVNGWYIDNVTVTVCAVDQPTGLTPSSVTAQPKVKRLKGKRFAVVIAAVSAGKPAAGDVQVLFRGRVVRTGAIPSSGVTTLPVRGKFPKGKQTFTVRYLGTAGIAPSETTFTLKVVKKGDQGKKGRKGKKNRR